MNILVIGNGFDLAHGLPTHYTDFLEFINMSIKYKGSKVMDINKTPIVFVNEYFKRFLKIKDKKLSFEIDESDEFKKFIEKKANGFYEDIWLNKDVSNHMNFWIQYFIKKLEKKSLVGENWVDFEREITECVSMMEIAKKNPNSFKAIMEPIISILKNQAVDDKNISNIDTIMNILEKDLVSLIGILEIYILLVNQLKVEEKDGFRKIPTMDHIVSFNYTDTYKLYWTNPNLKKNGSEKGPFDDFVHGKAGAENVILGAGETLTGNSVNTELSCIRFKKYFQRMQNRTGSKYMQWFKVEERRDNYKRLVPTHNVYIYGHSLDITDKDILSYIILHELTEKATIYYYENDEKSDYEQSIINLIQVIGKEELTARVGDGRIEFISTKDLGGKSEKATV